MSCEKMREDISAYLDGELGERELAAFRSHLESCADCRAELAEQEKLWALLDEGDASEVSVDLTRRILESTVGPHREREMRRRRVRWVAGVAAAASVLIAVVLWRGMNPPVPTSTKSGEEVGQLDAETVAVIKKLEVLENLEILEDLDLLQAAAENPIIIENPDTVSVVLGEGSS